MHSRLMNPLPENTTVADKWDLNTLSPRLHAIRYYKDFTEDGIPGWFFEMDFLAGKTATFLYPVNYQNLK